MPAEPQFEKEADEDGRFVRQESRFREVIMERPEPGRFHLYVSLACPWASRAVIVRQIMGLEQLLPMTVVDPIRDDKGWRFTDEDPDPVNGFTYLQQAYELTEPGFSDRVTVEQIVQGTRASHYGVRSLVHALIQSDLFLSK